jgi:hypothetical protein
MKSLCSHRRDTTMRRLFEGIKKVSTTTAMISLALLVGRVDVSAANYPKAKASARIVFDHDPNSHFYGVINIGFGQSINGPGMTAVAYLYGASLLVVRKITLLHHKDIDMNEILHGVIGYVSPKGNGKMLQVFIPSDQIPMSGPKSIIGDTVTIEFDPSNGGPTTVSGGIKKL